MQILVQELSLGSTVGDLVSAKTSDMGIYCTEFTPTIVSVDSFFALEDVVKPILTFMPPNGGL